MHAELEMVSSVTGEPLDMTMLVPQPKVPPAGGQPAPAASQYQPAASQHQPAASQPQPAASLDQQPASYTSNGPALVYIHIYMHVYSDVMLRFSHHSPTLPDPDACHLLLERIPKANGLAQGFV